MCTLTLFSAYICVLHLFNTIFANVIININEMVIDKIKEICEKRNLTITELGRMIGLKKSSIYSVINNGNPTVETLEKIKHLTTDDVLSFIQTDADVKKYIDDEFVALLQQNLDKPESALRAYLEGVFTTDIMTQV